MIYKISLYITYQILHIICVIHYILQYVSPAEDCDTQASQGSLRASTEDKPHRVGSQAFIFSTIIE